VLSLYDRAQIAFARNDFAACREWPGRRVSRSPWSGRQKGQATGVMARREEPDPAVLYREVRR